jgi:hypothetical protein
MSTVSETEKETRPQRVRVQLDLASGEAAALDALRERLSLRSRADAVRVALGVIEWMSEQASAGRRVVAVGDRDIVHLVVPGVGVHRTNRVESEVSSDG